MNSCSRSDNEKALNPEQIDQILDSILDGKYSWACVLLLRYAGYEPVRYIPHRTYTRLMKENGLTQKRQDGQFIDDSTDKQAELASSSKVSHLNKRRISDLSYLEPVNKSVSITGGYCSHIQDDRRATPPLDFEAFWHSDRLLNTYSEIA